MPVLEVNEIAPVKRRRLTPTSATENRPADDKFHEHTRSGAVRCDRGWHLLSEKALRGRDDEVSPYDEMDEDEEMEAMRHLSLKALEGQWDDDKPDKSEL